MERCPWCGDDPLYVKYHDMEWGVPEHDDHRLFEFLILEGAQAGLSWITVLRKRENYRRAMDGFDPERMARYDERKMTALLSDVGLIRNRRKMEAAVHNARAWLALREGGETLDQVLWQYVEGEPVTHHYRSHAAVPATTPISEAMSRDLKKRGFRFVGPTIMYAFMQAAGLVNDHLVTCPRHGELVDKVGGGKPE